MRRLSWVGIVVVLVAMPRLAAAQTNATDPMTIPVLERRGTFDAAVIDQAIDRIIAREHYEYTTLTYMQPLMLTHIQDLRLRSGEITPWREWNLQSRATIAAELSVHDYKHPDTGYDNVGFLQEAFIDRTNFDRAHYSFHYDGEDTLDGVPCLMFGIRPLGPSAGRFYGRIWANETDFTIIRFRGTYEPLTHWELVPTPVRYHEKFAEFDSRRYSAAPGVWLPERIDSYRDTPLREGSKRWIFKAETSFSGYDLSRLSDPKFPAYDQARFQRPVLPKATLGKKFWIPWVADFGMVATSNVLTIHCADTHQCASLLFGSHVSAIGLNLVRDAVVGLTFKFARNDKLHERAMWWHFETYFPLALNFNNFFHDVASTAAHSNISLFSF